MKSVCRDHLRRQRSPTRISLLYEINLTNLNLCYKWQTLPKYKRSQSANPAPATNFPQKSGVITIAWRNVYSMSPDACSNINHLTPQVQITPQPTRGLGSYLADACAIRSFARQCRRNEFQDAVPTLYGRSYLEKVLWP